LPRPGDDSSSGAVLSGNSTRSTSGGRCWRRKSRRIRRIRRGRAPLSPGYSGCFLSVLRFRRRIIVVIGRGPPFVRAGGRRKVPAATGCACWSVIWQIGRWNRIRPGRIVWCGPVGVRPSCFIEPAADEARVELRLPAALPNLKFNESVAVSMPKRCLTGAK
jgi:hypothetical protein